MIDAITSKDLSDDINGSSVDSWETKSFLYNDEKQAERISFFCFGRETYGAH